MKFFDVVISKTLTSTHSMRIEAKSIHAAEQQATVIAETHNFRACEKATTTTSVSCTEVKPETRRKCENGSTL